MNIVDNKIGRMVLNRNIVFDTKSVTLWLTYFAVLLGSFFVRFFNIDNVRSLIFDEKYYVKDGYSVLKYGYEKQWLDGYGDTGKTYWEKLMLVNNEQFVSGDYNIANDDYWSAHPPLGKIFIALGMLVGGYDNPAGWRLASVVAGTVIAGLTMVAAFMLFRKHSVAILAGVMVGSDGMMVAMSRVGYLDIFQTMLLLASFVVVLKYLQNSNVGWLYVAAVFAGFAMGVKWSTFYFILLGLTALTVWHFSKYNKKYGRVKVWHYVGAGFVSIVAYFSTWVLWLATYASTVSTTLWGKISLLISEHFRMIDVLSGATGKIINNTNFVEWMMVSRPSLIFYEKTSNTTGSIIATMPNLVFWFTAVAALTFFTIKSLTPKTNNNYNTIPLLIIILSLWLPWVFQNDRITFQYYSSAFTPYLYILGAYFIICLFKVKKYRILLKPLLIMWFVLAAAFMVFVYNINTGVHSNLNDYGVLFLERWYIFMENSIFYDKTQDGWPHGFQF